MEYKVIRAKSIEELEWEVAGLIYHEWEPIGGVAVFHELKKATAYMAPDYYLEAYYMQAMVRRD